MGQNSAVAIAHVAAEMGISRACASKWVNRYRHYGELGLHDRSSTPHQSPNATPAWVLEKIKTWRRENKWSASRITHELAEQGFRINRRTVKRHLTRLGLGNRRFLDPTGDGNRTPRKIVARWPGHMAHLDMAHLDVKKVGRIPDGGGWRIQGRDSQQAKTVDRAKAAGARRGYVYLYSIVDGFSGWPTPSLYATRRAAPQRTRARSPGPGEPRPPHHRASCPC